MLRRIDCYYGIEVKDMKPLKVKVSITLDEDIVNKVKELAEKNDRSLSQYINILLKNHLKKTTTISDETTP